MSADCLAASALIRAIIVVTSTTTSSPGWARMPSSGAPRNAVTASLVAMSVLLGTQSKSTQAPPAPSRSTTVTSAPSWTATSAAS
jgi:hypothetical protein